ncbi:hypothetical protein [Methylobacterium aerolatum]|uniref:Uncharacterized protein n=1 Tax=Methylobacterium aerolatum TaxID=418708 RepID=A0ABU0I3B7_9HYPH|nr:hypothetical protein [Methylobacterium aerolatum]MDQ0448405.1 hypothetical protein [Methylobacterium aerolatum]GJD34487.1 hypothetical protein FMGBMHLM_1388 [Methylobacterium aerolatum]
MRVPPSLRPIATAVGLLLPLASLPAQADPRSWVDPPAKGAADKSAAADKAGTADRGGAKVTAKDSVKDTKDTAKAGTAVAEDKVGSKGMAKGSAAQNSSTGSRLAETPRRQRAERIARHRAPAPRRLADTPAANGIPTGYAPAGRVEAAQALALEYLSVVSSSGEAMVGATPRFYGTRVRFYGRPATQADLLDEKRDFVRRWPERRYAARAFNTRCTADGSTCVVRAIVDFRAASPERGVVSKGASELVLEVSFSGQRPVIVAESGRVLHRGADRAEGPGAGRG